MFEQGLEDVEFIANIFGLLQEMSCNANRMVRAIKPLVVSLLAMPFQSLSAAERPYCQGFELSGLADKYLLSAHLYHDSPLKSFNQSLSIVNKENCHALFGCECLLSMTSLARPSEKGCDVNRSDHSGHSSPGLSTRISEWINLIRRLPCIMNYSYSMELLSRGPMAPLLSQQRHKHAIDDGERIGDEIVSKLQSLSKAIPDNSDSTINEICQGPIQQLRNAFKGLGLYHDAKLAFSWPILVHQDT